MTKEEIDILWNKAMRLSIEDGDQFTRYRFAELVAAAEREACAKVLDDMADDMAREMEPSTAIAYVRSKAAAIRARGQA